MKILFAGSPKSAIPVLKAVLELGYSVDVLTNQPKKDKTDIEKFANDNSLDVFYEYSVELFAKYDIALICAYGKILSRDVLNAPKKGCLNVHYSLLPRWRGASPVQSAILAGDKITGVCIQKMVYELDAGDTIGELKIALDGSEDFVYLMDKLANLAKDLIIDVLPRYMSDEIELKKQDENFITKCTKINKDDGIIDPEIENANKIYRKILAYKGWPSVYWKDLKIIEAKPIDNIEDDFVGINKNGILKCADNTFLQLLVVQNPGKKALNIKDWINGIKNKHI